MPATIRISNRSSASSGSGGGKQSTLNLHHRVTKHAAPNNNNKKLAQKDLVHHHQQQQPASEVEAEVVVGAEKEKKDTKIPSAQAIEKPEAELRAEKVTDSAVERYWSGIEALRSAGRVHQGCLSTGEKTLRYFDVDSRYGPCIGISRLGRWRRAERLGLDPPIELLAVLLRDDPTGERPVQQAHMEGILSSTADYSTGSVPT